MSARSFTLDHDTPLLLPPNLRHWVPKEHLVHFLVDAVEQLDLSAAQPFERSERTASEPPCATVTLVSLLVYSYVTGSFSSRVIERLTYENVALRFLCADAHPDRDVLRAFRKRNTPLLGRSLAQVLEMAARCEIKQVGGVLVSVRDGKAVGQFAHSTTPRLQDEWQNLEVIVAELLHQAEEADATPLEDGFSIPKELQRRRDRKAKLTQAQAEMEALAAQQKAAETQDEAKTSTRQNPRESFKRHRRNPGGRLHPLGPRHRFMRPTGEASEPLLGGNPPANFTKKAAHLEKENSKLKKIVAELVMDQLGAKTSTEDRW